MERPGRRPAFVDREGRADLAVVLVALVREVVAADPAADRAFVPAVDAVPVLGGPNGRAAAMQWRSATGGEIPGVSTTAWRC